VSAADPTTPDHVRATVATSDPTVRVPVAWTTRFTLLWLGFWMAWLVPIQLVLPNQFDAVDAAHKVRDFGITNGAAGAVALIALPLFGALCDRTTSRFGRRRVWMAAGVLVFAAALAVTGLQDSWTGVMICWLFASLGFSMASAGLFAAVADQVPIAQRGIISGAIFGPQALGLLVGLVILTQVVTSNAGGYVVLTVFLLILSLPFVLRYREALVARSRAPLSLRGLAAAMWVSPRRYPDFAWAFGGRVAVNIGNALGTTYLLYFFQHLHLHDPDNALLITTAIYLVFTLLTTYGGGTLSDRTGRRRVFVVVASVLQAIAALLLVAWPSFEAALIAAAFLGAGYGASLSVDQALVTQVLPDAESRAKDLGIMNIGNNVPQSLAPLAAALIIDQLGGYRVLFGAAGVFTIIGAVMVYRIKSVR
jgi:MFS family permease